MYTFIIVLIILVSVLLIITVLAQNSKGGGLASGFSGAGTSQLMGVKRTSDLLEQITWGLAIALILLTLSTGFVLDTSGEQDINSVNIERAPTRSTLPPVARPADSTAGATQPAPTPQPDTAK